MRKKLFLGVILLVLFQLVFFMIPLLVCLFNDFSNIIVILINVVCIIVNSLLTWKVIKEVEKLYYKKYNKFSSLLYNVCPLIGVTFVMVVCYYIFKNNYMVYNYFVKDMIFFYISSFVLIYVINIIYLIINQFSKN